ncbi:NaeI family type II restriction endonuclease [Kocuria sp. NPDC057446]|uniref:NaeI family type II restriction endonuclease n=1 Tax=Kocuria sp. NPDC057446 TaxID=3346137 RepID=UPI0036A7DD01
MANSKRVLAAPGSSCLRDPRERKGIVVEEFSPHAILSPSDDDELQRVFQWLQHRDLASLLTVAVDDAVKYVLDGSRTGRFDLNSDEVDSDERSAVGTNLQYRIINVLGLLKERPLDTVIDGTPVELKATVRNNWMIPTEGQCEVCLLSEVDTKNMRHRALLMRTHRAWLNKPNKDKKRTIWADAIRTYSLAVLDWTPLPPEPLKLLTPEQLAIAFAPRVGQTERLTSLFGFLPDTVFPRSSIETVCSGNKDPMRRARQAKSRVLDRHGFTVLCGAWREDLECAAERGYDISNNAWIALSPETFNDSFPSEFLF